MVKRGVEQCGVRNKIQGSCHEKRGEGIEHLKNKSELILKQQKIKKKKLKGSHN